MENEWAERRKSTCQVKRKKIKEKHILGRRKIWQNIYLENKYNIDIQNSHTINKWFGIFDGFYVKRLETNFDKRCVKKKILSELLQRELWSYSMKAKSF